MSRRGRPVSRTQHAMGAVSESEVRADFRSPLLLDHPPAFAGSLAFGYRPWDDGWERLKIVSSRSSPSGRGHVWSPALPSAIRYQMAGLLSAVHMGWAQRGGKEFGGRRSTPTLDLQHQGLVLPSARGGERERRLASQAQAHLMQHFPRGGRPPSAGGTGLHARGKPSTLASGFGFGADGSPVRFVGHDSNKLEVIVSSLR